jgi:hypothetical protein
MIGRQYTEEEEEEEEENPMPVSITTVRTGAPLFRSTDCP